MAPPKRKPRASGALRPKAQSRLSSRKTPPPHLVAEGEVRVLRHELQVHRVELEAQNEELQRQVLERSEAVDALQEEVARRTQAEKRSGQLQALAAEMAHVHQQEGHRVARVLYDELQQLLTAANFRLAPLETAGDHDARQAAADVRGLIDQAIACSRSLTGELSPPILQEGGLIPALEWLAERMKLDHALHVELTADPRAVPPTEELAVLLFRAVRELLLNVVKHARAKAARVHLTRRGGLIAVTVSDAGMGFDPAPARPRDGQPGGIGLFGLRERLALLGGSLKIDSARGRGARITLRVPLHPLHTPEDPAGLNA